MKENEKQTSQETDRLLDIRSDPVFKAVFTKQSPESAGALSNLVSALIGRKVSILSILSNEPPIENIRDRQVRFDINCRTEDGELVNVEMCYNPAWHEPVRLEFHAAKLFMGQDIKGINKEYDDLKQTYQIAILAKGRFFSDNNYYHSFEYYDPVNRVSLNGRTRIITLELVKANGIAEKLVDEMTVSGRWAFFFEYLTSNDSRDKINEILEKEEGIFMANQVLSSISRDEEERARIMRDEKILLDYYSGINYAKRTGFEEGRKQGQLQLLDMMKQGLSVEEIEEQVLRA